MRAGPLGMLADGTAITVWSTTALRATVGPPGAAFGPAEPIAPAETPPGRDSPRPRLPRPGRRRPRRTVDVAVIAGCSPSPSPSPSARRPSGAAPADRAVAYAATATAWADADTPSHVSIFRHAA